VVAAGEVIRGDGDVTDDAAAEAGGFVDRAMVGAWG
jgi:hypothetical protein